MASSEPEQETFVDITSILRPDLINKVSNQSSKASVQRSNFSPSIGDKVLLRKYKYSSKISETTLVKTQSYHIQFTNRINAFISIMKTIHVSGIRSNVSSSCSSDECYNL